MKTMKRFLTLFFVVLLICTSVPVSFAAIIADGKCGKNVEWSLDSNGTLTISGTGNIFNYDEDKNDWDYWDVKHINGRIIKTREDSADGGTGSKTGKTTWKEYNDKIKKIVIKNGVTSIGENAFSYIHYLTSVTIPGSVIEIGTEAFYDCWSLKSIVIPEGVQSIKHFAFGNCDSLGNVYLPVSLKKLSDSAFFVWDMALPISTKHHVYYAGSKAQWNKIVITGDKSYFNSVFKGVTMHYNSQNTSSGNNTTNTASITLDQTKITVYQGTSATLKATVTGKSSNVTWKSSNTKIATVSNGKITGKAPGSCKITATANGKSATCKVVVKSPTIDLNKTSTQIYKDCTRTLKATVKGASQKVKWVSNNTKIATVSSKGVITAKKTGTCNITATANGVNAICEVTVLKPKVVLNKNSTTLYAGAERTIKAKIYGKETKAKWSSSNESVATVNQNGCITGVKEGNCVVTATANGVKAKCKVTVLKPTITLDKSNLSLFGNSCYLLKATVKGNSKTVTWKSSNDKVAKVNSKGMVDAIGAGTCTITATANGVSASCKVKVVKKETQSIELTSSALTYNSKTDTYTMKGSTQPQSLGVKIKGTGGYDIVVKNMNNYGSGAFYTGGDMITAPYAGTIEVIVTTRETAEYYKLSKTFTINVTGFPLIRDENDEWDYYQNDDGTVTIARYNGISTDPIIPARMKIGLSLQPVTALADYAFKNKDITSLSLDSSAYSAADDVFLKKIGNYCFENCSKLKKIYFLDLVTSIGEGAFYGCTSLERLDLSNDLRVIPKDAFKNCTSITGMIDFPVALRTIGESAFSGCSKLLRIHLHQNLTSIEENAFNGCSSLKKVYYSGPNSSYHNINIATGNAPLTNGTATIYYNSGLSGYSSLTDEQLFRDYARFLLNNSYESITDGLEGEMARILANQTASDEWWSAMKSQFLSGGTYAIKEWLEIFCDKEWTEDQLNEKIAIELLKSNLEDTTNNQLDNYYDSDTFEAIKKLYSTTLKEYKSAGDKIFSDENTREKIAGELQDLFGEKAEDLDEIKEMLKALGQNWEDVKSEIKELGYVFDAADFLISYLRIYEIGETRISELMDLLPDEECGLYKGLKSARSFLNNPFSKAFYDELINYTNSEFAKVITSFAEKGIERVMKQALGSNLCFLISNLFYKFCGMAMNIPTMEDRETAWLVLCNTMTLRNAASDYRYQIMEAYGTADDTIIGKYQLAMSVYFSSIKQAVPYVAKIEGHAFGTSESNRPLKTALKKYQDVLNWEAFVMSCKANAQGL